MISTEDRREIRRYCKSTGVDYLLQREELLKQIKSHTENGMVKITISGIDCDGVEFWGRTVLVKASTVVVEQEFYHIEYNADGRVHMEIVSPSSTIQRGSYDRINK